MVVAGLLLTTSLLNTQPKSDSPAKPTYDCIGTYRTTTFCRYCNSPAGTQSASGVPLEDGHVAMNGVALGTEIYIDGRKYEVTDRCGIDGTVDIYCDQYNGYCTCNTLKYKKIFIKN